MPSHTRSDWMKDLLWLTLLFCVFYACWIGSYPLFTPDEGRYTEVAREMIQSGDYITPRVDGVPFLDKPILYYWLQAAALSLFGIKEWAIRLFPALLGLIGCLTTYIAGHLLFDRRTGLLSAIILGCSPLYFAGAHYANLDLEVAALISCSLLCLLVAMHREGWGSSLFLITAYLFAGLAFLTKGMIAIVFPAMIMGLWILIQWRWRVVLKLHLIMGFTIIAAIALPWYLKMQAVNPEFFHYFFITQQFTRFISGAEFNNQTPFWFYAPVILVGFFPWTIFLFQSLGNAFKKVVSSPKTYSIELYLLIWLTSVFLFFSLPASKIIGYILPVFPPLALLVGRYLSLHWTHPNNRPMIIAMIHLLVIGTLLTVALLLLPTQHWFAFNIGFHPHLFMIATIFAISIFAALFTARAQTLLMIFLICVFCSTGSLLTLIKGASYLNVSSTKTLVTTLKPLLQPGDEVINYFKFYQDVPLYLDQRITLVADWNSPNILQKDNWVRELWYGKFYENTDAWLVTEPTFWKHWNSGKRVFVFLNANYFDQFKSHASYYYVIQRSNEIILLSNQMIMH